MMAGLSVLLEAQEELPGTPLQVVSKTTLLRPLLLLPPAHKPPPTSTFLEACFLCGKHLSEEKDIYMYRGDRAFCSVECRCRQIFMDEEESIRRENCSLVASPTCGRRKGVGKHSRQAAAAAADTGGFAY